MRNLTPAFHAYHLFGQLRLDPGSRGTFMLKVTIAFCCFFLTSNDLASQKYETTVYDRSNGLSHNNILSLDTDADDNLWIASLGGINKFEDGIFESVQISKLSSIFQSLLIDENQVLWAVKRHQEASFVPFNERIVFYNIKTQSEIKVNDYIDFNQIISSTAQIYRIWRNRNRSIFIHTNEGLFRFQDAELKLIDGPTKPIYYSILTQDDKSLIRMDLQKAQYIDLESGQISILRKQHDLAEIKMREGVVSYSIFRDTGSTLLSGKHLMTEVTDSSRAVIFSSSKIYLNLVMPHYVNDSTSLITTLKSAYLIHDSEESLVVDTIWGNELSSNRAITAITSDQKGKTWIGTNNGLIEAKLKLFNYEHYFQNENVSTRNLLSAGPDTVLVASYAGLKAILLKEGKTISYPVLKFAISIDHIENGRYLVAISRALYEWDIKHPNSIKTVWVASRPLRITDIIQISENKFWCATTKGVHEFDLTDQSFEAVDFELTDSELDAFLLYKSKTHPKILWIIGRNNVFEYDLNNGALTRIKGLEGISVSFVYEDVSDDQIVWLGTIGQGLVKYHRQNGVEFQLSTFDDLANNSIHSVYEDDNSRLWMSSNVGIASYNKVTGEIQNYLTGIDEAVSEFNFYSSLKLEDGSLLFGSINGVIKFNPNQVVYSSDKFVTYPQEVVTIEEISEKGKVTSSFDLPQDQETKTHVSRGHHNLRVQIPRSTISEGTKLRYMLTSTDNTWTYAHGHKFVLGKLPAGKHNLLISKKLGIHEWSEAKIVSLDVAAPFYYSPWFLAGIAGVLTLGIFGTISFNNRQLRKRNARIEQKVNEQTQKIKKQNSLLNELVHENELIFKIIGHDLRSPVLSMTQVSNNIDYALKENNNSVLEKLGASISSRSRAILHMLDDILAWGRMKKDDRVFSRKNAELNDIVNDVVSEMKEPLLLKRQKLSIISSNKVFVDRDGKIVHIVVRNILSNAIKFSKEGARIVVEIENRDNPTITVKDQGAGIPDNIIRNLEMLDESESQEGTSGELGLGLGLTITKMLMKYLNGIIHFHTEPGMGTSVQLVFPLKD